MPTQRFQINPSNIDTAAQDSLQQAADLLRSGGTVAFPTETVYGLGANALDAVAVAKIFTAKQRPSWDPLIVHVASRDMLSSVVSEVPKSATLLMEKFWPGPLTLLLPRHPGLPLAVTAGRDLVGVRMPNHPVALALIKFAGVPIAAPSANRFGHTSPTTAQHVLDDLDGRIDAVIDSGPTAVGVESTVLDLAATPPIIYRPGAVTIDMLRAAIGEVTLHTSSLETSSHTDQTALPSPGVGIRHYAPRARLLLADDKTHLAQLQSQQLLAGKRVGILMPEGWGITANGVIVHQWAAMSDPSTQAHQLFAALRTLDDLAVDVIIVPLPSSDGIGGAMRDRLRKAAMQE
jgi:L-threonylcarbamoyladenylate synthase